MNVPIEELKKEIGNVYQLVIVAARRTRQIADGAPKLVDVKCSKPGTAALWEIAKGRIKYKLQDKEQDKDKEKGKEKGKEK